MNQLETNLVLWAIISIILFEILFLIWICRYAAKRIKPKRFYVKVIYVCFLIINTREYLKEKKKILQ